MNGEDNENTENTVKFYKYKNTSGRIILSKKITDLLKWHHLDEITIELKSIKGGLGLCLYKKGSQ